ncbi:Thioredoxin-like [Chryseobacterium wanjuense]|uniref:Thioredoxin-like n=1 Tax=Chryseobacterium wanjuense TaxID=356305 RepID=A0A1I0RM64_9FLAO|nr:thioredoxin fold domain-containing protein [Chryseobacterium wanjuense]SEW42342.1 Thioredoxin-like [Chryseobacterium wanjuense]
MKKILLILSVFLVFVSVYSFKTIHENKINSEVNFYNGSLKEAVIKAKKEKKMIFLDIYATWCGPCKLLKKTTFKDPELSDYLNKKFISLEINGEEGEGKEIVQKYQLKGYPSLLFIDTNGNIVNKTLGYYDGKQLLEIVKEIK